MVCALFGKFWRVRVLTHKKSATVLGVSRAPAPAPAPGARAPSGIHNEIDKCLFVYN